MGAREILLIAVILLGVVALIAFTISRNRKDLKQMNPDAEEKTEEVQHEQERRKEGL